MTDFVSLSNHTQSSLLHSLITPKELFSRAKELGQKAVGITDYGTCAAIWDCWKASKDAGLKFIPGCKFYFTDDVENKTGKLRYVSLLACNASGYKNILALNRLGFDHSSIFLKRIFPIIDWKLLEKHSEGTICLTGCGNGIFGQLLNDKNFDEAEKTLHQLHNIFGQYLGVEVQSHNMSRQAVAYLGTTSQIFTNAHSIRLANKHNLTIIPTTNAHYMHKEDAETHDVLLAIAAMQPVYSNNRIKYDVSDLYVKSGDEVRAFFARNNSEEFAAKICANTVMFADMCEEPNWIEPKVLCGDSLIPVFDVKSEKDYNEFKLWKIKNYDSVNKLEEDAAYLRYKCDIAIKAKELDNKQYRDRLNEELEVLEYQKFSSYMLVVADYVTKAREMGVQTSQGRGSVGGSLVAYLLDIHKADPIKYGLIFARFQNKERKSPPDIDLDFATSGREKVIDYIKQKYGSDNVISISNLNRITPKVYARDVARSCELGGSRTEAVALGNNIANAIPADMKAVVKFDELQKAALFGEYCKRYPKLAKNGNILGMTRNYSSHAAAIVISKKTLPGLVPLRKDKDGAVIVEYEKEASEANGLLKVDILGLSTIDIVEDTLKLIKKSGKEVDPNYVNYDYYDKPTYDLITRGDTYGVFQLGVSATMIGLCKKIKPKSIDDLSIITTLGRPAARNVREDFIRTKDGKKEFTLLHQSLKNAFEKTYGYGLYDESILQLGQDVAGWSLHSADRIRKMIKEKGKHPERDEQLRIEFIEGAVKNGIERNMAIRIWNEEVSKFQGYTFNKSHATVYSLCSYTTAFLKAHYPLEFLLANLMHEIGSNAPNAVENIDKIKRELQLNGIKTSPPNINTSPHSYQIQNDNSLLTGLDALKFVGEDAIEDIVAKRPFTSFDDFMLRTDPKKVSATSIKALAASGALDCFNMSRKLIFMYCQDYRKKLQVWQKKPQPETGAFEYPWPVEKEWSKPEIYALEKHYIGEAFTISKKEAYGSFFNGQFYSIKLVNELCNKDKVAPVKAEIKSVFISKVKKETSRYLGQDMVKANIEDHNGDQITLTIFPDRWKDVQAKMKQLNSRAKFDAGLAISFSGTVNEYNDEVGIIMEELYDCALPPTLPKDLKAKKLSIRKKKSDTGQINLDDTAKTIESLEDDLFSEGFIDLNDEDDDI